MNAWRDVARAGLPSAWTGDDRAELTVGRRVQSVAILWFAGVVVVDVALGRRLVIIGLVNISTLLVTAVTTPIRTGIFAVAALGALARESPGPCRPVSLSRGPGRTRRRRLRLLQRRKRPGAVPRRGRVWQRPGQCPGGTPPLLLHNGQLEELLLKPGLPLGLGAPDASTNHPWGPGDRLLLYTDGLIEARDNAGRFLSLDVIGESIAAPSVDQALDALTRAVQHHVPKGRLVDDVCLLLLENEHTTE